MDSTKIILEAIALQKCFEATYNRTVVQLAPHVLYTKHDELFVDAVTVARDGQPPKEIKLGTFKLAGLKIGSLIARTFRPEPLFDPTSERYAGVTLFAVEPVRATA